MKNRIREVRKRKGLTMKQLGAKLGLAESTISQYETDKREPDNETLLKIGEILGVSVGYLLGEEIPTNSIPYQVSHKAPIVGSIPAGYPVFAQEDIEGYADIPYSDEENYFFLRVDGESMKNAGIHSGDLVLIRKQACADDGQIVAARVNGDEATLKRYMRQGDTVLLLPENSEFSPYVVPVAEFERGAASIIGVVIELRRNM